MPGVIWSVEMHNIVEISLFVRREVLTITLSMEAISKNVEIVQCYSYTRDTYYHMVRVQYSCVQYNASNPFEHALTGHWSD